MTETNTEIQTILNLIDTFTNLQRILNADDIQKEAEYQLKIVKAKLESFGIVTENLEINN